LHPQFIATRPEVFVALVLLLWATTMSWLMVAKILPPFFSGEPPKQGALLQAAGYPDGPGPTHVFFGDRGSEEFAGFGVLDMSLSYNVPVFRTLRPWVKFDVYNLFNGSAVITQNNSYGSAWLRPTQILQARLVKFGVQLDF
jgi:hypothetical protein